MNTPIGALRMEAPTTQLLVQNDIKTVEDLVAYTPSKLRRLPNFARRHLVEVHGALAKKNLKLAE